MYRKQAKCKQCGAVLLEREMFCRTCGHSDDRKDKWHELVRSKP